MKQTVTFAKHELKLEMKTVSAVVALGGGIPD